MIKVIIIDGYSWEKYRINPDKDPNLYWYESPILEKFINEGWTIKDWKFAKSRNGSDWTFILEKEDEETSSHKTTYKEIGMRNKWDEETQSKIDKCVDKICNLIDERICENCSFDGINKDIAIYIDGFADWLHHKTCKDMIDID